MTSTDTLNNSLIINSPFEEPNRHMVYDDKQKTYVPVDGRRKAGYTFFHTKNDQGIFYELELVNELRALIKDWRADGYPHTTDVTRALLANWNDPDARMNRFFFCQLEAIETLIYLNEVADDYILNKIGTDSLHGERVFDRVCTKLCTGGGKTIVMAMLIAYMFLNYSRYGSSKFAKNILIIAPNLTVADRLKVLKPTDEKNYYDLFGIVPDTIRRIELNQAKILILNWQKLSSEESKPAVDTRPPKSDSAYANDLLKSTFNTAGNFLVINDEAHHAYRIDRSSRKSKLSDDENEATVWITGLDRIHRARKIFRCYDFSATPFTPGTGKSDADKLFSWIVSDFGLYDGIESGLVKTPRMIHSSDGAKKIFESHGELKNQSLLFHIYAEADVKKNLDSKQDESAELPNLVQQAYELLSILWKDKFDDWKNREPVPPVMITVANNTTTTARIKYAFDHHILNVTEELCEPDSTLRIDSKIVTDELRKKVDSVGKENDDGKKIRNVISVGMLSEGWDARNVTQILGLRAFSSQLLCEQVLGRGLRRMHYDFEPGQTLYEPEFVDVLGIPMNMLMIDTNISSHEKPTKPGQEIKVVKNRREFEINIPNVFRIDHDWKMILSLDLEKIPELFLPMNDALTQATFAPMLDDGTDEKRSITVNIDSFNAKRFQTIIFDVVNQVFDETISNPKSWQKSYTKFHLIGQIIHLVEDFIDSGKIKTNDAYINEGSWKILYAKRMRQIVLHVWDYIEGTEHEYDYLTLDEHRRVISTSDMPTWYSRKKCLPTEKSHISHMVCDSSLEEKTAKMLEKNTHVKAWVKNDHIGFQITYFFQGQAHKYIPDFVVLLDNGTHLIIETKGEIRDMDKAKRKFLQRWISAVNYERDFGFWAEEMSSGLMDVDTIIDHFIKSNS